MKRTVIGWFMARQKPLTGPLLAEAEGWLGLNQGSAPNLIQDVNARIAAAKRAGRLYAVLTLAPVAVLGCVVLWLLLAFR